MNVRHPQELLHSSCIKKISDKMDLSLFHFHVTVCAQKCGGKTFEIYKVCAFIILIQAEMGGKINGLKATSILKANQKEEFRG